MPFPPQHKPILVTTAHTWTVHRQIPSAHDPPTTEKPSAMYRSVLTSSCPLAITVTILLLVLINSTAQHNWNMADIWHSLFMTMKCLNMANSPHLEQNSGVTMKKINTWEYSYKFWALRHCPILLLLYFSWMRGLLMGQRSNLDCSPQHISSNIHVYHIK